MTQEDKELLLKDLCARLPYGVKIHCNEDIIMTLRQIDENCFCECWENEDFKCHSRWMLPYLRPMSSIASLISAKKWSSLGGKELIDWYNANHIDYRGLIEKGLAIKAPEEMYNKKGE